MLGIEGAANLNYMTIHKSKFEHTGTSGPSCTYKVYHNQITTGSQIGYDSTDKMIEAALAESKG